MPSPSYLTIFTLPLKSPDAWTRKAQGVIATVKAEICEIRTSLFFEGATLHENAKLQMLLEKAVKGVESARKSLAAVKNQLKEASDHKTKVFDLLRMVDSCISHLEVLLTLVP